MGNPWTLRVLRTGDSEAVRVIFNFYIEESYAAYAQQPLSLDDIQAMLISIGDYPAVAAEDGQGRLIGFGFLRPYSPHATFARTAMITYFIASEHTGRGLGTVLLQELEGKARERGITHLLAHVSSRNTGSLMFHRNHRFRQCGCFHEIGCKHGQAFDVVWFEKGIS
jgi:L-amino acid N-acyltransferase YncA